MKFIILIIFSLQIRFFLSQTFYLSPLTSCVTCNGNLSNPYPDIQTALSSNPYLGQMTLCLLDGVYSGPNNTDITIMYMVFTITSQNGPNFSIFDCQGNSTVFYLSSSNFYIYNVTI